MSLGVFLCFQLSKHFDIGDTRVAELAGMMDLTRLQDCMSGASTFWRSPKVSRGSIKGPVCYGQMRALTRKLLCILEKMLVLRENPTLL